MTLVFGDAKMPNPTPKISNKVIITYNREMQDKNITVIPAWKYFWEED
jgi:hypothetical protein